MESVLILKALADDTRLKIIKFLFSGKKNAGVIVKHIQKSQPNTSLAIKQLLMANLLVQEKNGRKIIYSLKNPEAIKKIIKATEELA
jgi:DNA-binding transcriptional ArsR family regulator